MILLLRTFAAHRASPDPVVTAGYNQKRSMKTEREICATFCIASDQNLSAEVSKFTTVGEQNT
jgi:hypothetical protein